MTSPVPFGLSVLKPNLIPDTHQRSQRLDVQRRLPEQDLDFGPVKLVNPVSGVHQAFNDVGHGKALRSARKPSTNSLASLPTVFLLLFVAVALAAMKAGGL